MFAFLTSEDVDCVLMPKNPGEPVLYKDYSSLCIAGSPITLFIHVGSYPDRWVYSGEYNCRTYKFSTQEFRRQNKEVRLSQFLRHLTLVLIDSFHTEVQIHVSKGSANKPQ
jgi:hypothetical protein